MVRLSTIYIFLFKRDKNSVYIKINVYVVGATRRNRYVRKRFPEIKWLNSRMSAEEERRQTTRTGGGRVWKSWNYGTDICVSTQFSRVFTFSKINIRSGIKTGEVSWLHANTILFRRKHKRKNLPYCSVPLFTNLLYPFIAYWQWWAWAQLLYRHKKAAGYDSSLHTELAGCL